MTILKLFGFTAAEQQSLQQCVNPERWEQGLRGELHQPRPDDEVWVVCVHAAEEFWRAVSRRPLSARPSVFWVPQKGMPRWLDPTVRRWPPPPAVLWVPQGREPLELDEWWEGFHEQLHEEHEADRALLQRISRCVQVLTWAERVEDVPTAWFAALTGSPLLTEIEALPFPPDARQHLQACADCCVEAYERLQQRAERRWELLCPSVEAIAAWLEVEEKDPRLETHVASCGLCRETVQRQAWLWEGAGLLPAAQVNDKLAAVGLDAWLAVDEVEELWTSEPARTVAAWAALLVVVLCRHTALRSSRRVARGLAEAGEASLADLEASLVLVTPWTPPHTGTI